MLVPRNPLGPNKLGQHSQDQTTLGFQNLLVLSSCLSWVLFSLRERVEVREATIPVPLKRRPTGAPFPRCPVPWRSLPRSTHSRGPWRNALGSDLSLWSPQPGTADWLRPDSRFAVARSVLAASPVLSRGGRGSRVKSGLRVPALGRGTVGRDRGRRGDPPGRSQGTRA